MNSIKIKKEKLKNIIPVLTDLYPTVICTLDHENAFQLLIATSLAAQCTDARVNIVTKELFKRYPDPYAFAIAKVEEVEEYIRSTGFYRNKAKNILSCSKNLVENYHGEVPVEMEELIKLAGVGRKTANVVRGTIFKIPSIIVDTHCIRLSNRIGLTTSKDPEVIEQELMKIVEKKHWTDLCHRFVYHGRAVCDARKPRCNECKVAPYCDFVN